MKEKWSRILSENSNKQKPDKRTRKKKIKIKYVYIWCILVRKTRELNKYWTAFDDQVLSNKLYSTHGIGILYDSVSFISIKPIPSTIKQKWHLMKTVYGEISCHPPLQKQNTINKKPHAHTHTHEENYHIFRSFPFYLIELAVRERLYMWFVCFVYANVLLNWKWFQSYSVLGFPFRKGVYTWACVFLCSFVIVTFLQLNIYVGVCVLKQKSNEISPNNVR